MPAFIEYFIKLSICLAIVYLFYQLFLRRLTFYNWNRWYLLGYASFSFIIPVVDIMPQLQKRDLTEATILAWVPSWRYAAPENTNILETLSYWDWATIIVVLGSLFFLVRFVIRFYSFLLTKSKAALITEHQTALYHLDENITPFSFGNAIFINSHLHAREDLDEIIRHEFVHVKQKHTIDIIFVELLCIINWFNPFAWLLRKAIKQNLEFIADDKVVQNGFDKKEYQYLLLKVMGHKQFTITNHFNFSNLKKRIAMMNTLKTAKVHLIKFLFLLPVIAVLLLSFRKEMQKTETPLNVSVTKDTIPGTDSGYKISVILTPGALNNEKMQRTVIERMSLSDWNKNKNFYEKKYGLSAPTITNVKTKEGNAVKYDSVFVTKYKPQPIPDDILFIIDGKECTKADMEKLKPNDIQTMTVLKDASATTLYGEKGKHGVIIIETKAVKNESNQPEINDSKVSIKGYVSEIFIEQSSITNQPIANNFEGSFHLENDPDSSSKQIRLDNRKPMVMLDGKEITYEELKVVKVKTLKKIAIMADTKEDTSPAIEKYGENGKNGVIELTSRKKRREKNEKN